MADYKEAPLASRPKTLDANEYFNVSKKYRQAEESRAAVRGQLKRQYLLQLNNPHRTELIEDPALTRWVHARINIYEYFKPTFRTSLLGVLGGALPMIFFYVLFKTDRDRREERIKAGTQNRHYPISS